MSETKEISIYKHTFTISAPYAEGHTCTAAEAKALNQVRAENIANNVRSLVKEADESDNPEAAIKEVTAKIAEKDAAYEFTLSSAGSRVTLTPVEREAKKIARTLIANSIKQQGSTITEYEKSDEGKQKVADKVAELMENPDVIKAAKEAVKAQEKQAAALEGIKISA